jgi:hypothetical protein
MVESIIEISPWPSMMVSINDGMFDMNAFIRKDFLCNLPLLLKRRKLRACLTDCSKTKHFCQESQSTPPKIRKARNINNNQSTHSNVRVLILDDSWWMI